jgi:hypothetical protein
VREIPTDCIESLSKDLKEQGDEIEENESKRD